MKKLQLIVVFCISGFILCSNPIDSGKVESEYVIEKAVPLLGWNSYTGYASDLNDSLFRINLEHFCRKLQPYGYEYFVIDAGWDGVTRGELTLDSFGRSIPHPGLFPNGLKPLIELTHSKGVKFGLWMGRGISRKAVHQNLPIYGTTHRAKDIASFTDTSNWFLDNYGVDMSKPGSQEYYNSVIALLASWGVDFIKYDDIVPHPDEIEAVVKAIELNAPHIKLSLSPGGEASMKYMDVYSKTDMVRITNDVWDNWAHIEESFRRWEEFQFFKSTKCNIDLDMIPFGILFYPEVHQDNFSIDEKKTFMTQRAMAASPLFLGGRLPEMDSISLALVTDTFMLECNRKGTIGRLICRDGELEIWKSVNREDTLCCWIGIFNRSNNNTIKYSLEKCQSALPLSLSKYSIFDIWERGHISSGNSTLFTIPPHGVVFLKLRPSS